MNFWELLKGAANSAKDWLGASNGGVSNWQAALGLGGNIYGAYQQQKAANKALKLQEDAYNFNKMLSQRQLAQQNQAQNNLNSAWANSSFALGQKKEDEVGY